MEFSKVNCKTEGSDGRFRRNIQICIARFRWKFRLKVPMEVVVLVDATAKQFVYISFNLWTFLVLVFLSPCFLVSSCLSFFLCVCLFRSACRIWQRAAVDGLSKGQQLTHGECCNFAAAVLRVMSCDIVSHFVTHVSVFCFVVPELAACLLSWDFFQQSIGHF